MDGEETVSATSTESDFDKLSQLSREFSLENDLESIHIRQTPKKKTPVRKLFPEDTGRNETLVDNNQSGSSDDPTLSSLPRPDLIDLLQKKNC